MKENLEAVRGIVVLGDHTEQADNKRVGTGSGTLVGIVRKANTKNGFPSDYLVGFLEKNNFVPRRFARTSVGLTGSRNSADTDPPLFSVALNTHPGKDRPGTSTTDVQNSDTLATPVVRASKLDADKVDAAGILTDVMQVVDDRATVVIKDDGGHAGHVSFYPSRAKKDGEAGVVDVKWRDTLTHLKVPSGSFTNIVATSERTLSGTGEAHALMSMTREARRAYFAGSSTQTQIQIAAFVADAAALSGNSALLQEAATLAALLSPTQRAQMQAARQARADNQATADAITELSGQGVSAAQIGRDSETGQAILQGRTASGELVFYSVRVLSGGQTVVTVIPEGAVTLGLSSDTTFGDNAPVSLGFDPENQFADFIGSGGAQFTADGRLILNTAGAQRSLRAGISGVPPTSPGEATQGQARAEEQLARLLDMRAAGDPVMNGPEGDRLIRQQEIAIEAYRAASLASTAPLADGSGRNPIATVFNDTIAKLLGPPDAPIYDAKVLGLLASTAIGVSEGGKGDPLAFDEIGGALDPNNIKKKIRLSEEGEWLIGHFTRDGEGFWRPIVPHNKAIGTLPPDEPPPPPPKEEPINQIPNPWPKERDTPPPVEKARKCGELDLGTPDDKPRHGEGKPHNPDKDPDGLTTCDRETPGGLVFDSRMLRLGAGKTPIQPRRPTSYIGKVDQRARLGAGVHYRNRKNREPLVDAGGIPLLDPYDFHAEMSDAEVATLLADKINKALSVLNGLLAYSTDFTNTRALHLPNQAKAPQTKFFDAGDVAIIKGIPHVLTTRGKNRTWSPMTQDEIAERWLGSGDGKEAVTIGIKEPLPNDKRAAIQYDPAARTFTVKNADHIVEGTQTVVGADGSENELETGADAALNIKGKKLNGTEVTRTVPVVSGTVPVASSITANALQKFSGTTGETTPSGATDDGTTLASSRATFYLSQKVATIRNNTGDGSLLTIQGGDSVSSSNGSSLDLRAGTSASGTKGTASVKDADGTTRIEVPPNNLAMLLGGALRFSNSYAEMGADEQLLATTPSLISRKLGGGGPYNLDFEDTPAAGRFYFIGNDPTSGSNVVVRNFGGAATLATLSAGEFVLCWYDGTNAEWRAFGLF